MAILVQTRSAIAACSAALSAAAFAASPDTLLQSTFEHIASPGWNNIRLSLPSGWSLHARIYIPDSNVNSGAILAHGCSGLWSNGVVDTVAQTHIERWGRHLAENGIIALAVDSYSGRQPSGESEQAFQRQCAGEPFAGSVDPYVTRVADLERAAEWLSYRFGARGRESALLGWSQGAQSILVAVAETYRFQNQSRFELTAASSLFKAAIAFYPGCGTNLGFLSTPSDIASSYWRPHVPIRLNHAALDPFHPNCSIRFEIANTAYGAPTNSGYWAIYQAFEGAGHSFDHAGTYAWPNVACDAPTDECAMARADVSSLQFLLQSLPQADAP